MKILKILLGMLVSSIGLMFIFLYSNLLTLGYSFFDFVKFISTRVECLLFFIGLLIIFFTKKGWKKNVLLLRHTSKFSR